MNKEIFPNYKGIIDSTLREGEQFCGSNFTLDQQKQIVELLSQIGVDRIEVGNPIAKDIKENITALLQVDSIPPFLAHVRNRLDDIQTAIDVGVNGVNILCTVDKSRLQEMKLSLPKYLDTLEQGIMLAQKAGLETRVSVEDYFTQSNNQEAMSVFHKADSLGVNRIGIADTRGLTLPWETAEKVVAIRKEVKNTDIEVHCHNDLGHATSNALTAVHSGANWIDTTILGIGERTGITPLSTLLENLYIINPDLVQRYDLESLTSIDNLIAGMLNIEIPFNLLTNGNGFAHKAGIHINAITKHGPEIYEPLPPGVIGNQRNLIIKTPISGRTTEQQAEDFYTTYGRS